MASKSLQMLLVTANVGSIFEDPSQMLKLWSEEFLSTVSKLDPKFIALHCQEVGGKNYEKSMMYVEDFLKLLMNSEELRLFDKVRVYIDEDYSSAENFTALGNIYFIHESVTDVLIWDFKEMSFVNVDGKEIYSGNIEDVITKEKAKFPQDFFPECKWSRKGFLRTRWSISGTVFDLINIHLFHDASNFIAMESFPSVYCKNRRRALEHTLQRFHSDKNGTSPYFVFGDFNFRTDTEGVTKKLTEGLITTRVLNQKSKDYSKIQFHNNDSELILTVGKKEFNHYEHQDVFLKSDGSWLKSYDRELESFTDQLYEYPVMFPPSYPFEESVTQARAYMKTRCPSWCDRVLLSQTARSLVDEDGKVEYNVMGKDTCMGDHKPVFLRVDIQSNAGIVRCCTHLVMLSNEPIPACKCCQSYSKVEINITDMSDYFRDTIGFSTVDSKLLHEPFTKDMLLHDPYTPESIESYSPIPDDRVTKKQSVSPRILKSRLENILRNEEQEIKDHKLLTHTQSEHTFNNKWKEHKKLIHTKSDSFFAGYSNTEYLNINISSIFHKIPEDNKSEHQKIIHTKSDTSRFIKNRPCRYLSKSQSQHLERSYEKPDGFRKRCMTEITRKTSRAKLIGADRAQSITRLQSHHSSSDEEWFEFEEVEVKETIETDTFNDDVNIDIKTDLCDEVEEVTNIKDIEDKKIKRKQKIDACCCIC